MSQPSIDARAIADAIAELATQVVRALGGQTTPVVGQAARTDDGPELLGWIAHGTRDLSIPEQAPAADEDAQRTARRNSAAVLLARAVHGVLSPAVAAELREHFTAEQRETDTARAVARSNLRHVQAIVPDMERLQRENDQLRSGRETWKGKAEDIEQDRDRIDRQRDHLEELLRTETARANAAIDREETAEQAAEEQRRRADIFETELRVLREGLRANGADPTQIQNLWAQIRLRNRQWREAKRERDRARHERDVIAVDLETADRIRADVQRDRDQHAAVLAEVLAAFVNKVDGYRSIPRRSAEADVVTLDKWRSVLAPTVERPWWQTVAELRAEVEQAQAAIERVRALHPRVLRMQALICAHCGHIYPCPTVRTLDGTTQPTPTLPAAGARQDVAQP